MRSAQKLLLASAVAAAAALAPGLAEAQSVNANMTVSATVLRRCVVTGPAAPVNFADYDPLSSAQLSAVGSITVQCVRGTGYTIALSSTNGFAMQGQGTSIPYSITQPNGTSNWTTTPLVVADAAITNSAPRSYDATVRPAIGQDVPAGNYTDTVLVTVTY
ncbi:MAG: spore coat protein U domain-containing protein [Anaeromyxobacteraceae bacterium]